MEKRGIMAWKRTDLSYWVPDWRWCELPNPGNKTKTGERCRFCQEIKKRGDATRYRCLIHNCDLYVSGGSVERSISCVIFKDNASTIDPPELEKPKYMDGITASKIVKKSLKEVSTTYNALRKDGYPEKMSLELAIEEVLDQWK